jgi:hypothetical protein
MEKEKNPCATIEIVCVSITTHRDRKYRVCVSINGPAHCNKTLELREIHAP